MDSKNTYLKNIIREEVKLVKEFTEPKPITPTTQNPTPNPFNNHQPTADAFRNWLNANETSYVKSNGITKTGSLSDPKLIKAFETYKKKYWTYLNKKNGTSTPSKGKLSGAIGAAVKAAGDAIKTNADNVISPFKTQQSADHFRKWIQIRHREEATQLGIGSSGSKDDPKLINAFSKWKKDYWADIKTQKQTQLDKKNNTDTSGDIAGSLGLTLPELMKYGVYAAVGIAALTVGSKLFKGARWLYRKVKGTKLTEEQAMNIAKDPKGFQKNINKIANANPKQLKKEMQALNPDEIITDADIKAMQKALGNPRLTVDILIQSRRTILQAFKNSIASGKLPKYKPEQIINTLTPSERSKYANAIRDMYAKAQKKKQFNAKVKRTWKKVRDKFPYGD
jgi:hypothetical protein